MHADVEHDAGGAHALAVQHPEPVARVVQVAELLHQALGVERPALAVAGGPVLPAPRVEQALVIGGLPDLEVMTGNALVVHRGEFAPGVELGDALGHAPPHLPGAGEVVGRAGVIDAALLRGGDHALQRAELVRDVELGARELVDGPVAGLLHPPLQRIGAVQLSARVVVEKLDGLGDRRAGLDLPRYRLLFRDHARQLLDAPLVGLVEIDDGAHEIPGRECVDLAADRVALRCVRRQLVRQEGGQRLVGVRRGLRAGGQLALQRLGQFARVGSRIRSELEEEPGVGHLLVRLGDDLPHLADGRRVAVGDAGAEGLDVPVHRRRQVAQASGDVRPVLDGCRGHDVEDVPQVLRGAGDHVEIALVEPCVMPVELQLEVAGEIELRDQVDVIDRCGRRDLCQRLLRLENGLLGPLRGVVGELALVSRPSELDPHLGIEIDLGIEPLLRDRIDRRWRPGFRGLVTHTSSV